jgi:hypothetical protein
LVGNYWTVLCLARQSLLLEVPHPATDIQKKIGHEDWGWNLQAMERGAIHKIVPGTGHGIRVKESGSVMRAATSAGVIPKPSNVFRKLLEDKERSLTAARASRGS